MDISIDHITRNDKSSSVNFIEEMISDLEMVVGPIDRDEWWFEGLLCEIHQSNNLFFVISSEYRLLIPRWFFDKYSQNVDRKEWEECIENDTLYLYLDYK